jgi:hypothetical protein
MNLILDNLAELVAAMGGTPNNTDTRQLAALGFARDAGVKNLKTTLDRILAGGCGYRVFARTGMPEKTCTVVCEAAPRDARYFVKMTVGTNGSARLSLIDLSLWFSLSGGTAGDITVRDANSISGPVAGVSVSGRAGGSVFITVNTGDICTLWHGTVEGSVVSDDTAAVGYKNLVVTGFFAGAPYGAYNGYENRWIIGDLDYDEDNFIPPPGQTGGNSSAVNNRYY